MPTDPIIPPVDPPIVPTTPEILEVTEAVDEKDYVSEQAQLLQNMNRILNANGGLVSNIGMEDKYWQYLKEYRANEAAMRDGVKV